MSAHGSRSHRPRKRKLPLLLLLALTLACRAEAASGSGSEAPSNGGSRLGRSKRGNPSSTLRKATSFSSDFERAGKLLLDYKLDEADDTVTALLDRGAGDDALLVLAGRIKEEMADGPAARRYYSSAVDANPRNIEARCYLARTLLGIRDFKASARHLRYALKAAPGSPLPPAVAALYYLQKGNHQLASQYVDKALALDPASKEASLVQADLQFLKRDLEGARHSIERLLATNPTDPDGLYMMGIVLFNKKDFNGAQTYLERSTGIHRYAANFLKDLAQVYAQNNHLQKAIETLDRVLELTPGDEAALSLQGNLRERASLVDNGVQRQIGPFHFVHPPDLPAATLDSIVEIFQDAYREICPQLGYKPTRVNIWVFEKTGSLLPAFYSHVSDEIIISSSYFSTMDSAEKKKLGRHLVFHEFSHQVLFQALKRPAFSPMALWLMEGLAEKQAGGYDYTAIDYQKTFGTGMLEFAELADYLPVSAVGAGEKREKAYIQAYLMVDRLCAQPGGLEKIEQMILGYAAGKSDAEVFDAAGLGAPQTFLASVSDYIKQSLASR